ncbi:hypothetical protein F5Y16DRAFT_388736 [Xylariaceae sp. FL0255]|nr:hypothetical protein F5Y16DRAFT_388736 [Xylariaceae sp. FL0255]
MSPDTTGTVNEFDGIGLQNLGNIRVDRDLIIGTQQHSNSIASRRSECLRRLHTSPYKERKNRNPPRADGTCEWFTNHDLFRGWNQKDGALLWVSADPGCGKSVLARYLIDSVLPSNPAESRTTCYFFFKDEFEDQRTVASALSCLLHQLFDQHPALLSYDLLEKLGNEDQFFASYSKFWDILVTTAELLTTHSDSNPGEVICILDALDECRDMIHLTTALTELYSKSGGVPGLKFLITSRPYNDIHQAFENLENSGLMLSLRGEVQQEVDKNALEISIAIDQRIDELCKRRRFGTEEKVAVLH